MSKFEPGLVDVLDILDPVLGEFLDAKSLGSYVQVAQVCAVNTRVWLTSDNELRKRWRTLGSIPFAAEGECSRRLGVPWRLSEYSWKDIELQQEIWGGQASQIFWMYDSKVLCIAGAVYPDQIGGATPLTLHDVCVVDIITGEVEPIEVEGTSHPQIMGCAVAYRRETQEVICFGGGAPHDPRSLNNHTSILNMRTRKWTQVKCEGEVPTGRQGFHGTIYEGRFYFFGGRELYGLCRNDMWAFDLETREWHEIATSGSAPSPRVWYAACHAPYGQWCVIGGSLWNFSLPGDEELKEFEDLYIFHFATHTWERIATPTSPEWCTSPALVPLGSRQLLFFGGCMVQKVDANALQTRPISWREWYPSIFDNVRVYDRRERTWSALGSNRNRIRDPEQNQEDNINMSDEEDSHGHSYMKDMLRRSHFSSCSIMNEQDNKVVLFGGSRYFTGEYFHDIIVFHQAPAEYQEYSERRHILAHARGQLGRLRALVRHGYVQGEQYDEILRRLEHV
eukprot:GEMP01025120.1.p1 GENE.GEMP01025120.1~~GEMP01025120.1.p1  ORF type:complete len:507 (+),score=75.12 GEMP01025120.1:168-1688(+)